MRGEHEALGVESAVRDDPRPVGGPQDHDEHRGLIQDVEVGVRELGAVAVGPGASGHRREQMGLRGVGDPL
jgi:hypothetical protein